MDEQIKTSINENKGFFPANNFSLYAHVTVNYNDTV